MGKESTKINLNICSWSAVCHKTMRSQYILVLYHKNASLFLIDLYSPAKKVSIFFMRMSWFFSAGA